jgi:hypothetical protein
MEYRKPTLKKGSVYTKCQKPELNHLRDSMDMGEGERIPQGFIIRIGT